MLQVTDQMMDQWQSIVDIMAQLINIPAGLIMRIVDSEIEVFLSSKTEGNPYTPGARESLPDSGLYCERVINSRKKLLVSNALTDPEWNSNPDIKLNMISYLGFPIMLPGGDLFGTICVLDSRENHYSPLYEQLMLQFKALIEGQLQLMNQNIMLQEQLDEIKTLKEIIPVCAHCKKVKDDEGYWETVDAYIEKYTSSRVSHGLCIDCMKQLYPAIYEKYQQKLNQNRG